MAEATKSIFNKKAEEKLRSPDDLHKYVQVASPSVWAVFLACIALLTGLFAWGVLGTVQTDVTATGVVIPNGADNKTDPQVICFVSAEDAEKISRGDVAEVGGESMTVGTVGELPMSADEVRSLVGSDYLTRAVVSGDWVYAVTFEGDSSKLATNVPVPTSITIERMAPITLIFRGFGETNG